MNIEGFGVGDANKKLTGIESTSGCKIEMSSSKDRSLTFLITGKQADVLKAKRMILVDFQTQANATIHPFVGVKVIGQSQSTTKEMQASMGSARKIDSSN